MTPDELRQIANTPGYGTGKVARDRMAAERDIRALLPDPDALPHVIASRRPTDTHKSPMCHMAGYSDDDGNDWSLYQERLIGDAATDAQIVAAILNAYRMGIIAVTEPQP